MQGRSDVCAPRTDAADLQHSAGNRTADDGAEDHRSDRRGQGNGCCPAQLKGHVVRALKRQEKVLESRLEGRERVWAIAGSDVEKSRGQTR